MPCICGYFIGIWTSYLCSCG